MIAIRVHETPRRAESLRVQGHAVPFQEYFPVPPHFDVLVHRKHEHWEADHLGNNSKTRNSAHRNRSTEFFNRCSRTNIAAYQHIRHLWRCAAFCTTFLQYHYQQSQRPTDASHRFTCFRQRYSTVGGKDNTGCRIQTTEHGNSSVSEIIGHNIQIFCLEWPILWPPRILFFPPGTLCI
jgi:hypothetical protein